MLYSVLRTSTLPLIIQILGNVFVWNGEESYNISNNK